jgi:hypothetical protein
MFSPTANADRAAATAPLGQSLDGFPDRAGSELRSPIRPERLMDVVEAVDEAFPDYVSG